GRPVGPDGKALAGVEDDHAEVVDAVDMVGMGMGVDDAVEGADIGVEKLGAEVGGGVDQDAGGEVAVDALDQHRAAAAVVLRVLRVTGAPMAAEAGDAARGAAAEDGETVVCHQAAFWK